MWKSDVGLYCALNNQLLKNRDASFNDHHNLIWWIFKNPIRFYSLLLFIMHKEINIQLITIVLIISASSDTYFRLIIFMFSQVIVAIGLSVLGYRLNENRVSNTDPHLLSTVRTKLSIYHGYWSSLPARNQTRATRRTSYHWTIDAFNL